MDKFFFRLLVICLVITGALFLTKSWLLANGNHFNVLLLGNFLLAIISIFSYRMVRKGQDAGNAHVFVRMVYGATLAKLMLCLVGILVYVLAFRPFISKPTIFILMFFYLVYTVVETGSSFRSTKPRV